MRSKLANKLTGKKLGVAQDTIANKLLVVSNVLSHMIMASPEVDKNFGCCLQVLKSVRRLFSINTKLVVSLMVNLKAPSLCVARYLESVTNNHSDGKPHLAEYLSTLLLHLSEEKNVVVANQKQGEGNMMLVSDSMIEQQGRIASSLVFEREKCDMQLLKISQKLKAAKLVDGAEFYLKRLTNSTNNRDFRIKDKDIDEAQRENEAAQTKKKEKGGGEAKAKAKKEKKENEKKEKEKEKGGMGGKRKRKGGEEEEEEDEDEEDDEGSIILGSVVDDENETESVGEPNWQNEEEDENMELN